MKLPGFIKGGANNYWVETTKTWGNEHLFPAPVAREDAIDLTSNDYLGLGGTEELRTAKANAAKNAPDNALMSPAFLPENSVQRKFEKELAEYMLYPAAVLTQSGWDANLCVMGLAASLTPKNPVYIDNRAHASLHAGIRLCGNLFFTFPHMDMEALNNLHKMYGPGWIVVDSVYSTDGAMPPILDIESIAREYNSVVVMDEAHALGIRGHQGRGLARQMTGVATFATISTSKSLSTRGGAVLLPSPDLVNCQRFASGISPGPGIFSSSVQGHEAVSMSYALKMIANADDRRTKLLDLAKLFRSSLNKEGIELQGPIDSPIVPLIVKGGAEKALQLRKALAVNGITGSVFAPPAVSSKRSMVRLTFNANLTFEQVEMASKRVISAWQSVNLDLFHR